MMSTLTQANPDLTAQTIHDALAEAFRLKELEEEAIRTGDEATARSHRFQRQYILGPALHDAAQNFLGRNIHNMRAAIERAVA